MKNYFKLLSIALVGIMTMSVVACDDGGGNTTTPPVAIEAAPLSISFNADGTADGDAAVTVTGAEWSAVANDAWITVTPVSGADGGSFTVSVTANTEEGAVARNGSITITSVDAVETKTVTVSQTAPVFVPVSGVALDEDKAHLIMTDDTKNTMTLTATVEPAAANNQGVTWSSSVEAVATVVDGLVTAVSPGRTVITVIADEGEGAFTAECEIIVTEYGFIIADANLPEKKSWEDAQTACPQDWRIPTGEELQCMCRTYHHDGAENAIDGWPIDQPYWSSSTAPGMFGMGETGARITFHILSDPDCTIAGVMSNSQQLYVRCIQDVVL